jgi:hypothetical protein
MSIGQQDMALTLGSVADTRGLQKAVITAYGRDGQPGLINTLLQE